MIVACVSLVVAPSLAAEYGVEILGPPGIPA
jgi:hypothetical protein